MNATEILAATQRLIDSRSTDRQALHEAYEACRRAMRGMPLSETRPWHIASQTVKTAINGGLWMMPAGVR